MLACSFIIDSVTAMLAGIFIIDRADWFADSCNKLQRIIYVFYCFKSLFLAV